MIDKNRELDTSSLSAKVRRVILNLIYQTRSPHIGPSFSCVEILISLYFSVMNVSPENPFDDNRDRFILSKGHACPALYAVLAQKGFLNEKCLRGFACDDGEMEQHPNRDLGKGIEISSGSLGHGLSIGVGMALAGKTDVKDYKTYILLGDGELNEGSVWEAVMFASHHHLDNLIVIVDYNKMQALGFTSDVISLEPLGKKWEAFGWMVREIDGHNLQQMDDTLKEAPFAKGKPSVVIANTIKGKGVSFMENDLLWHYRAPDRNEYERALKELEK